MIGLAFGMKVDERYWRVISIIYGAVAVTTALLWYVSAGSVWNWGLFFVSLVLFVYTPFSFKKVGPDELGTLLLFDKPLWDVGSGLAFAPLGFFTLQKRKKTIESIEVPADSRQIWHGDEDKMPGGMVLPLRITTGLASKIESALDNQQTVEVNYYVRFHITNLTLFIQTFQSMDEFKRQVEDTSTRCLQTEYGKRSLAQVIREYGDLHRILRGANDALVRVGGVVIDDTGIKTSSPGHTVNKALANLTSSALDRDAEINRAQGKRQSRILEGEGDASYKRNVGNADADAEKAMLDLQAEGFQKTAELLNLETEEARVELYKANLAADSMKHVKDIRIITGGNPMGSLFGLLTETAADNDRRRSGDGHSGPSNNKPSAPPVGPNKSRPQGGRPGPKPAPAGTANTPVAPASNPAPAPSGATVAPTPTAATPAPPITGWAAKT